MSTLYRTIRIPVHHHRDAGRYSPHIAECTGPMVTIRLSYIDGAGVSHVQAFKVVLRTEHTRWCNITLARTGQSIGRIHNADYRNAGTWPGNRSRPRQVAQAAIDRLAWDYGRQAIARTLATAEQAGPVLNPDILAAGHTTSHGIAPDC